MISIEDLGNRKYKLTDEDTGAEYNYERSDIRLIEKALNLKKKLFYENGKLYLEDSNVSGTFVTETEKHDEGNNYVNKIIDEIEATAKKKPDDLIVPENDYKYLIRNVLRGKNVMMFGDTGTGKTSLAYAVANTLERKFFKFPMNASGDAKTMLIGQMSYTPERGTFFKPSMFVEAIQTKNAVILLDEYTRCHPEAENILFSVLDHQRYLSIDEGEYKAEISVAEGVCFIATSNVGSDYTTTRVLDKATNDRFLPMRTNYVPKDDEVKIMHTRFPHVPVKSIETVCDIAWSTRDGVKSGQLETCLSTRTVIEVIDLISDGFTIREALDYIAVPKFNGNEDDLTAFLVIVNSLVEEEVGDRLTQLSKNNMFYGLNR